VRPRSDPLNKVALRPHARLPRQYDRRTTVLAATVDAWGQSPLTALPQCRTQAAPRPHGKPFPEPRSYPCAALVVTGDGGTVKERTCCETVYGAAFGTALGAGSAHASAIACVSQ
jgi:hypothetical protein